MKQVGTPTTHFIIQFDETKTIETAGQLMGQALLSTCETDYARLSFLFGGNNISHIITVTVDLGSGGENNGVNITACGVNGLDKVSSGDFDYLGNAFIAELSEIFMDGQNKQWNPTDSKGEALSHVLAGLFYPGGTQPVFTVHQWVDNNQDVANAKNSFEGLQDWVTDVFPSDNPARSIGCGVAFIHYMHYQLGFTFLKIVNTSGRTLADIYKALSGSKYAFDPFASVVRKKFPQGIPSGLNEDHKTPNSDNFFPLPSDNRTQCEAVS